MILVRSGMRIHWITTNTAYVAKRVVPRDRPVTLLMTFVSSWNSYISAQLYNSGSDEIYPLQLVLLTIQDTVDGWMTSSTNPPYDRYPIQFAGIIAAILPIMIAMPFFQDQLEAGVLGGAVKG